MQFASTRNSKLIRILGIAHPQCNVVRRLPIKPLADLTTGKVHSVLPGKWRIVNAKRHR